MDIFAACDGGRVFLAEFAKYRYGVFDEHGFLEDRAHPLAYVSSTQKVAAVLAPTSCTNDASSPGAFLDPSVLHGIYNIFVTRIIKLINKCIFL
jgi:hypothetical protein